MCCWYYISDRGSFLKVNHRKEFQMPKSICCLNFGSHAEKYYLSLHCSIAHGYIQKLCCFIRFKSSSFNKDVGHIITLNITVEVPD